jgi:hypothetical protein
MYQVVRVEAKTVSANREITCLDCGAPLQARQGKFVLKYMLLRPSSAQRRRVG